MLEHAAAVVTHAGHGTTIKALAAGVPLLAMPMGRDQPDNAARVAAAGAGLVLKPRAKAPAIRAALTRLLREPAFRDGARRMAAAIAADTATDRAVAEIEALAEARPRAAAAGW